MRRLTLYGRHNCHLCHEMHAELERLRPELGFDLETVDVHGSPELEQRYGARIPVLVCDGTELCEARLDHDAVRACVQGAHA